MFDGMTPEERHAALEQICEEWTASVRKKHFEAGHPVVYGRDGEVVFEFADGTIVPTSIQDEFLEILGTHPACIDYQTLNRLVNLPLSIIQYLVEGLVMEGRIIAPKETDEPVPNVPTGAVCDSGRGTRLDNVDSLELPERSSVAVGDSGKGLVEGSGETGAGP